MAPPDRRQSLYHEATKRPPGGTCPRRRRAVSTDRFVCPKEPIMRARSLIVALAAIAGLTLGAVGLAGASDDTKCHLAIKGDSPTKAACDRGGRKEAAKTMKGLVKAAQAKGTV